MKTNMGNFDRSIRAAIAVVIGVLYFKGIIDGPLGVGLLTVAIAFVITSFLGFCPLYVPFGLSTLKKKSGT